METVNTTQPNKKRRVRSTKFWIASIALVGLLGFAITRLMPDFGFVTNARQVCQINPYKQYLMMSEDEAAVLSGDIVSRQNRLTPFGKVHKRDNVVLEVMLLNLKTGKEKQLEGFNKTLSLFGTANELRFSPDRKKLIIGGTRMENFTRKMRKLVGTLNDDKVKEIPLGYDNSWLPDSSGWAALTIKKGKRSQSNLPLDIVIQYVDSDKIERIKSPKLVDEYQTVGSIGGKNAGVRFYNKLLGVTAERQAIVAYSNSPLVQYRRSLAIHNPVNTLNNAANASPELEVTLKSFSLDRTAPKDTTHTFKMSKDHFIEKVVMSPDGESIVWVMKRFQESEGLRDLVSLLTRGWVAPSHIPLTEVYISKNDGSQLRLLGKVVPQVDLQEQKIVEIKQLQWLPNSKGVAFLYKNYLYIHDIPRR